METRLASSAVHAGSWWFWHQVRGRRVCLPFKTNTWKWLFSDYRVGRKTTHQHHTRLGLQTVISPPFDARLRKESPQKILTCYGKRATTTFPKRTNQVRSQQKIQHKNQRLHHLTKMARNLSNKYAELFFWAEQSTAYYSAPSVPLRHIQQSQQKTRQNKHDSFSTI